VSQIFKGQRVCLGEGGRRSKRICGVSCALWKTKDIEFGGERERERERKQRHKQSWKTQGFCFCNYYSWLRKSKDFDFWKREREKQSWKSQGFFFLQLLLIVEKQSGMYFSHFPYFLSEI
jgi:hypothetical protein